MTLYTNSILPSDGLPAGASGGGIIQVVSTQKTDTFITSSTSFVDITGVSASITPRSTSNKVFITMSFLGSSSNGNTSSYRLFRGTTNIAVPDTNAAGGGWHGGHYVAGTGHGQIHAFSWLDSPATTSSTTYKVQMRRDGGTGYIGRHPGNDTYNGVLQFTLMEVSG